MSRTPCRHPACACEADAQGFCGAYCANAVESTTGELPDTAASACACGHPACTERQRTPREETGPSTSIGPQGGRAGRSRGSS